MVCPSLGLEPTMKNALKSLSPRLGVGTIWLGRPWPPSNVEYTVPTVAETDAFLDLAFAVLGETAETSAGGGVEATILLDTASA